MKNTTALLLAFGISGSALAQSTIIFPASNGDVIFPHTMHKHITHNCLPCHDSTEGGKIAGLDRKWVQRTCRQCHQKMLKGPIKCGDCHKRY